MTTEVEFKIIILMNIVITVVVMGFGDTRFLFPVERNIGGRRRRVCGGEVVEFMEERVNTSGACGSTEEEVGNTLRA